ncbi:hypothetical protein [Archangium sp.]|uniref:hypothetical protein n=1 Tax=Archangium sp. TaxID=1872627 RepID=UPI002D512C23|nr:hypothetical protein [Archangium sp.]HYO57940.1 hypothetical protein [Archangium sp.]
MSRTKLILAGLLAGAVAFGTACRSDSAAERGEPMEPAQGTTPGSTSPGDTGGSGTPEQNGIGIYDDYTVPQEDRAGTGGTGYEDPVTHPDSSDTSGSKREPGSQDDSESQRNQE